MAWLCTRLGFGCFWHKEIDISVQEGMAHCNIAGSFSATVPPFGCNVRPPHWIRGRAGHTVCEDQEGYKNKCKKDCKRACCEVIGGKGSEKVRRLHFFCLCLFFFDLACICEQPGDLL